MQHVRPRIRLILLGLAVAAAAWALQYFLVADQSDAGLFALAVWLPAGAAAGWLVATLRMRSQTVRAQESRLDAIQGAASDAILRIDADGRIATWSPGATAIYGYGHGEIVGRPLGDLFTEPDEAERLLDGAEGEVVEQRRRDGGVFSAELTLTPTGAGEAILVVRDVGELRRLTDDLHNTRAQYRSLRQHLPLVTYVQSLTGETTFVSPQIDGLLGYTAQEWLEDPDLRARLVHDEDRQEVEAASGQDRRRLTYRMHARDGRVVWVRDEAVQVLDESGRPFCIQGFLLDVTARKTAESERKELRAEQAATAEDARNRQQRIDLVAEAASVLASSRDVSSTVRRVAALLARDLADWCVVDVLEENGAVARFAAEGEEPDADLDVHPGPAVVQVVSERRPTLADREMILPLVSRGRRAIGALTLVRGESSTPFGSDDLPWARAVAGMIGLAIDNSRLHDEVQARADANRVLTHVGDGVFLLDRGGVIRLWNPASAEITGVSADSAVGKPAADAIPEWNVLSERIALATAGEAVRASTLPLDTKRGERWISISGVEFPDGTVYAIRDVTEEHQLEVLKTEFIATASHELRTPLAAVYGAAQTLRRHDFALDDAGRERFIRLIVDESDRLATIVNQILLANQLEVGRVDIEAEPFDGAELVERVVDSRRTHAPDHIRLEIAAAGGLPLVAADKDRTHQVLVNLVDNAIKYSPGGGRVEVGVETANGSVVFRVADEGLGIPADEQRRIFEKFYRLDPNMTKGIGGTGLGLYICSELVERMGGQIWLESEEGRGSSFFFELPSVGAPPVLPRTREVTEAERV
ncbi:MAG TPA: PAS domain S-box protein [Gaiellaceae bacterium]|nr:PAS domain S-box protein [Gaiellaceae bacterium]